MKQTSIQNIIMINEDTISDLQGGKNFKQSSSMVYGY